MGLKPVIYRHATHVVNKRGAVRVGLYRRRCQSAVRLRSSSGQCIVPGWGFCSAKISKPEAYALSETQQKLQTELDNESGQIANRYIKGDERSFTIIAYPVPEIGGNYEEIFREIVKINTLDYKKYQKSSRRS